MAEGQDKFVALVGDYLARRRDDLAEQFQRGSEVCGSEIERLMLAGLLFCDWGYGGEANQVWIKRGDWTVPTPEPTEAVICPQYQIGRYRADFAVLLRGDGETLQLVVECDGHDFHEKTKEQAGRDKRRDREMQAAGWRVFRFTGSEIFNRLEACIEEIARFGDGWIQETVARGRK